VISLSKYHPEDPIIGSMGSGGKPFDKEIIYYDEKCIVCRNMKKAIEKLDKQQKFLFQPYEQTPEASSDELTVKTSDTRFLYGIEAVEYIVLHLPHSKPIQWLLERSFLYKGALPAYKLMRSFRRCSSCPGNK